MTQEFVVLAGRRRSLATLLMLHEVWELASPSVRLRGVVCRSEWNIARMRDWSRRFGGGVVRKIAGELGLAGKQTDVEQQLLWDRLRETSLQERSIPAFCQRRGIPFQVVADLERPASLTAIRELGADTAIYSGAGILRKPLLECFPQGVLNLHCGPLPAVRGMNGVEWSLFLGLPPKVTLHHIDTGIDTGPILADRLVPVRPDDTLGHVRGRAILTGLELLRDSLPRLDQLAPQPNPAPAGKQYFQMTARLQQIASRRIAAAAAGPPVSRAA
jgi:hypothetical protein